MFPRSKRWRRSICCATHLPDLKIRVVNVVDLMTLQPPTEHPHGLSDREFDSIFTTDKPVVFAFHGYPWLIHRLTYRRTNHDNLHVRGYKEEGTTTTPFDMTVLNDLDRFHLAGDVIDRVPRLRDVAAHFKQFLRDKLIEHRLYVRQHGEDMPDVQSGAGARRGGRPAGPELMVQCGGVQASKKAGTGPASRCTPLWGISHRCRRHHGVGTATCRGSAG